MLGLVATDAAKHGTYYAGWCCLAAKLAANAEEAVLVGEGASTFVREEQREYNPFRIWLWAAEGRNSTLPVFEGKGQTGKTLLYVCRGSVCEAPVELR
jgi:uncharacterized protein YyaL (SSP411 family)